MKVTEHLDKAKNPLISFEIIPPLRGGDIRQLFETLEDLIKLNPPFIDVTSHSAEVQYEETAEGQIKKKVKRKRPGTIGISVAIKNKYNIDTVPHLLCRGFTKEETEDALIELNYLGIENVLAIQGDDKGYKKPTPHGKTTNEYADELVEQITAMNKGKYLEEDLLDASSTDFCIGIAGYPEKHYESPNIKADMEVLKSKIKKGAHYVVTQMFYRNDYYFNYLELCRQNGIQIPVIPGLKILTSKRHLTSLPKDFFIDIPEELYNEVISAKDKNVTEIGVEWAAKQVEELLNKGVPAVHFYILQNSKPVQMLFKKLKL
ncbi:MAG: methylenetetrahydrofolate reductase [Ignavibacteria bacterium]|nr:methylenetetrahydrofolate reductase [Ignavibacteria bacterium]